MTEAKKVSLDVGIISVNPMDVLSTRENSALPARGGRTLTLVRREYR